MKLNQFIHRETVARAKDHLVALRERESASASKTDHQRELDRFFAQFPNDQYMTRIADLLKITEGYRPETLPPQRVNFQIMARPDGRGGNICWVLIKGNAYGFADLNTGYYTVGGTDVTASVKEAEAFIRKLEKLVPDDFANWVTRNLGIDTLTNF